ncbi:zinc ribbon domain-containing protein [Oryzomicrobium sp.]|uniref:FmdB family zinc ribbon protein n=1 Tax=Oryzomicrobium sp. TaxID=1911578 RepID=UPI0025DCEDFF|nr:zinc ribbon domain-containing protein [Oryzomicrobium sp.]MCE1244742.1 zinc ribbon domain-containing protein [Oryzomicrobium sp.]
MPLHDFRCQDCAAAFEALVRAGRAPVCPLCGSGRLEKCVSLPAAPGKSATLIREGRARAARAGHFSHYGLAERVRLKKNG